MMEKHAPQPSKPFSCGTRVAAEYSSTSSRPYPSAVKFRAEPDPEALHHSTEKQRRQPADPVHNTSQRPVGPRELESVIERKYLISNPELLWSDLGSAAIRRLSSNYVDPCHTANSGSPSAGSAAATKSPTKGPRNKGDKTFARRVSYAFDSPAAAEVPSPSSSMTNCLLVQHVTCSNNPDKAAQESDHLSNCPSKVSLGELEDLSAKNSDNQPVYACMERAVDLFLDHNKLLEDLQSVQPVGLGGATAGVDITSSQGGHSGRNAGATPVRRKALRRAGAARYPDTGEDVAGGFSPSGWAGATTPASNNCDMPAEPNAYATSALNSVSTTRVYGTQGGTHVVLTALEWDRFKRTVTNLISANLELHRKLQLTQRHFRSLGYSGKLEQTLAKLKCEELRVRRELALRESEFADSFTLGAKLQHHKDSLTAAEQGVCRLKDQAQKIDKVKELLAQVKECMHPQRRVGIRSHAPSPCSGAATPIQTNPVVPGANDVSLRIARENPYLRVESPYVEIHKCVRVTADKCFIVSVFVPAFTTKQQRVGEGDDGNAAEDPGQVKSAPLRTEAASHEQEVKLFVTEPLQLKERISAVDEQPSSEPISFNLQQVGQLFLRKQMEETISSNMRDIILVVYDGKTSDANIQPLKLHYPNGSSGPSFSGILRAAVGLICRNLRLATLPLPLNAGNDVRSNVARYTLVYAAAGHAAQGTKVKARVVLGDELDETNIHDGNEELLYVGCHAMRGCPGATPRHYLVRLYRCPPRYLLARVFSPRSPILHCCWIDAHWAEQVYSNWKHCRSAPPSPLLQKETAVFGGLSPTHGAKSPCGAATPTSQCVGSAASDGERADCKRVLAAVVNRADNEAEGGATAAAATFTPSFLRFVAASLAFEHGRLCFRVADACDVKDINPHPSLARVTVRPTSPFRSEKGTALQPFGNRQTSNNPETAVYSNAAFTFSTAADRKDDCAESLCEMREKHRLFQGLLHQTSPSSRRSDVISITHAQIVSKSPAGKPASYKPCFMLIQSCIRLTIKTVTFVTYEPGSSWWGESSFSLLDALTLLRARKRTFLQRLAIDEASLEHIFSLAKNSSFAAPQLSYSQENQRVRTEEADESLSAYVISPQGRCKERDNYFKVGASRSSSEAGACGEVKLADALQTTVGDVGQAFSAQGVTQQTEVRCANAGFETSEKGNQGHVDYTRAEVKRADGAAGVTAEQGLPPHTQGPTPEGAKEVEEFPRGIASAACEVEEAAALEKQEGNDGTHKTVTALAEATKMPSMTILPSCTEAVQHDFGNAQNNNFTEASFSSKSATTEKMHTADPQTGGGKCLSPASNCQSSEEHSCAHAGANAILPADTLQAQTNVFVAGIRSSAAEELHLESVASDVPRLCLSEAHWRSLLQEIYAGMQVCGNNITIPGLRTVPVPGLWKIMSD